MTTTTSYTLADYLLDRLVELGADRVFGVPGDFTLCTLDHVERHPAIEWVGCANELGAGYAADGYARMRGIGVLCTTFGVGELSAINALAGSYAEHVPVVHLVGAPSRASQAAHVRSHHSLGDGDFGVFARMTSEVVCAQASLGAGDPCAEIDRVLESVVTHRRPGYLLLPADLADMPVERPSRPLAMAARLTDADALQRFRADAARLIGQARTAALLADVYVQRMGAEKRLQALVTEGALPHATLLWGRRVVDEGHPCYLGTYSGAASDERVRVPIEQADVLIMAGVRFTDLTSGFFSQHLDNARMIEVGPRSCSITGTVYEPIDMSDALDALTRICGQRAPFPSPSPGAATSVPAPVAAPSAMLTQTSLWQEVADALRPGDLILADQGTSFYGLGQHHLPSDTVWIGQPLWASIGYTLPALLGAALAAPERRPVLLIGDGAAQLTVAELGTMLRHGLNAIVIVVNNDGYTVERAIHGKMERYNDIASWDWTGLPGVLGKDRASFTARTTTVGALRDALATARRLDDQLSLIEAVVPRLDVPPLLARLAEAAAKANKANAAD